MVSKSRFSFKTNINYDIALLQEVESHNPFAFNKPKTIWEDIASKLLESELKMPVMERSCKKRTTELLEEFASDENLSSKLSGVSEEGLTSLKFLLTNVAKLRKEKPSRTGKILYSKKSRSEGENIREQAVIDLNPNCSSDEDPSPTDGTPLTSNFPVDTENEVNDSSDEPSRKRVRKGDVVSYLKGKHLDEIKFKHEELKLRVQEAENKKMELELAKEKQNFEMEQKRLELELLKQRQDLESQDKRILTEALINALNKNFN